MCCRLLYRLIISKAKVTIMFTLLNRLVEQSCIARSAITSCSSALRPQAASAGQPNLRFVCPLARRYASLSPMRMFVTIIFLFYLSGCAGQYYYVREHDSNRTYKVVYEDENLWLALHPMSGSNSSLMFSSRAESNGINVEIKFASISIIADGKSIEPISTTFGEKSITLEKGKIYSMVAKYQFPTPPEAIEARLKIRASLSGSEISIDEVVNVNIVEYGFWGALMSI